MLLLEALSAFSFLHQPLTLPLVYGDAEQFAARRRLFVLGPIALAGVIADVAPVLARGHVAVGRGRRAHT